MPSSLVPTKSIYLNTINWHLPCLTLQPLIPLKSKLKYSASIASPMTLLLPLTHQFQPNLPIPLRHRAKSIPNCLIKMTIDTDYAKNAPEQTPILSSNPITAILLISVLPKRPFTISNPMVPPPNQTKILSPANLCY